MGSASETAVLFDLDRVLVDSRVPIGRCIRHALDTHGLREQSALSLERFIGPPLTRAFAEMVGDRSFDILGAHACGLPAIGVSWGIGSVRELTDARADLIVDDPQGVARGDQRFAFVAR